MVMKPNQCPRWAIEPGGRDGRQQVGRVVMEGDVAIESIGNCLNAWSGVGDIGNGYFIAVRIFYLRWIHGSRTGRSIRDHRAVGKPGFSTDYSSADAAYVPIIN